jgi:hypothetical protein
MRNLMLIILFSLILLTACNNAQQEPTGFPPPEGYTSWEEYSQSQDTQNQSGSTKTINNKITTSATQQATSLVQDAELLAGSVNLGTFDQTAWNIYEQNNPWMNLPITKYGVYGSPITSLNPGQQARVVIESQVPISTDWIVLYGLGVGVVQTESNSNPVNWLETRPVNISFEDYVTSGDTKVMKFTFANTTQNTCQYFVVFFNRTPAESFVSYSVTLTGNTIPIQTNPDE